MKKNTLLLFAFCFVSFSYSQDCTSNSQYATYAALNNGFIENVSTTVGPGDYITISDIVTDEYIFTSTHSILGVEYDDYITITNGSNTILSQGESPLTYTFASGGTYRVHLYLNASCDTEDLNLNLTLLNATIAPTTCQLIENPRVSYRSNTRMDLFWDAPSLGGTPISYDWEAVPAGSSQGAGDASGNTTTNSFSATGLTSSTSYTFFIKTNCGANGSSDWYETPSLSTNAGSPPDNDFCSGATLLLQETGIANSGSATSNNGTLINTAGTNRIAEICNGDANARDDVWYSFLAQTTDINITLDPEFDGILSLFSGNCNALGYLDCSDANDGSNPKGEEINYSGLSIGQTYYFRVYYQGFAASNPNFTVKLWSSLATTDNDGDGYSNHPDVDCNDGNASINPGASEICDGLDNNCDGQIDEGLTFVDYYADIDSDTFGDPNSTISTCDGAPSGYVTDNTDCNDNDVNINPDATEILDNGEDDDCNPGTLDSSADIDDDGDGFTENEGDCDDTKAAINPNAVEICDGIDNDCDGDIDDADSNIDASSQSTWYADTDEDGFGDSGSILLACVQPVGYVADNTDCDDNEANAFPGNTEVCDGIDNDCDGDIDDADASIIGQSNWYADTDGDGFGDSNSVLQACNKPNGYVSNSTDCDDNESNNFPGNPEVCDGIDNDCDGLIDDADPSISGQTIYYIDADGDNYGDEMDAGTLFCSDPGAGYSLTNDDCVDSGANAADINPGQMEIPNNGLDDDCDPGTDDTLGIDDFNLQNIRVYPNPFSDKLLIQLPLEFNNDKIDIDVYDLIGRSVIRLNTTSNNSIVEIFKIDSLPQGIYLIEILNVDLGRSVVKRIIKN